MNSRRGVFLAGMVISFGFIAYAIAAIDFRGALTVIANANMSWILPFLLTNLVAVYLRAVRLRYILWGLKIIPANALFSAVSIGNMGNAVFPLRSGELIQVYLIARREQLSKSAVLAALIVEKVFDVVSILMIFFLTLLLADRSGAMSRWIFLEKSGIVLFVITGISTVFLYGLLRSGDGTGDAPRLFFRLLPDKTAAPIGAALTSFRLGLQVFNEGKHITRALFSSLGMYGVGALAFSLALPIFGMQVSIEAGIMMMVCVSLAVIIPSSPGFVGPWHAAIIFALGLFGTGSAAALGAAIMMHFLVFLMYIIMGVIFAVREHLSYAELRHADDLSGNTVA